MEEVRLADGRKKAKWSRDPRGMAWSNDKEKFGYKMLMKMGWSDGSGLGATLSGQTNHVKVAGKRDTLGLGKSDDNTSNWTNHQDGFNDILANLQKQNSAPASAEQSGRSSPVCGLQAKASRTRSRINYSKFLKSKDMSCYSSIDLDCIFGSRDQDSSDTEEESAEAQPNGEGAHSTDKNGLQTMVSGQSVQDYFAAKLAKVRAVQASSGETTFQLTTVKSHEESIEVDSLSRKLKKRQRKEAGNDKDEQKWENSVEEDHTLPSADCSQKMKKIMKRRKREEEKEEERDNEDNTSSDGSTHSLNKNSLNKKGEKKGKKSKKRKHEEEDDDSGIKEVAFVKPKKARRSRPADHEQASSEEERTSMKKEKTKKKKKSER